MAPWKRLFAEHIDKLGGAGAEFTLGTVTPAGLPRVRTCIFRGFWASLPENDKNQLPKNPAVYESDCPTFTTDARMNKAYQVFATGKGKGNLVQSRSGTGGGGPVEAVYWVKDVMTQWRIRGRCWLLAADDLDSDDEHAQNSGTVAAKAEIGRYMRAIGDHAQKSPDWGWGREIENHFENMSPIARGMFKNPPPGQPIADGKGEGEILGQKAGHLRDEHLARQHFRVCVITPQEVEMVDLSDPSKSKRKIWSLSQETRGPGDPDQSQPELEWSEVETWP